MESFTIKKLAERAGVNPETVRFYERKGIMPPPKKNASGYRYYTENDVRRLHFIQMAKKHGFTLSEIKELLELKVDPHTSCEEVQAIAEEKIQDIQLKINELTKMKNALKRLAASCHSGAPAGDCPILEEFEKEFK